MREKTCARAGVGVVCGVCVCVRVYGVCEAAGLVFVRPEPVLVAAQVRGECAGAAPRTVTVWAFPTWGPQDFAKRQEASRTGPKGDAGSRPRCHTDTAVVWPEVE